MVTGRENPLKTKRKYEKSFLKNAWILWLYQIEYNILSKSADFIFSGREQKTTGFLRFMNRAVNNAICKCQAMAEKCEYYKQKIENFN